ncbi:MAG: glycosyltransferase family 2 protein [Gammaproteobacteria bacterium]|nr:glycosyltransferase family 2 protein [Gammaproteobacteria bacterium]
MTSPPVSVVIISANSAETIQRCLKSLTIFDEVIVYLTRCTDNTAELCAEFENVRVINGEFSGFGPTRNVAVKHARNPWILVIDTDEWLYDKLKHSIQNAKWDSPNWAYVVRRHRAIFGAAVDVRGVKAQRLVRLYHRETGKYDLQLVHESVELRKNIRRKLLQGKLWHEKESRDRLLFEIDSLDHGVAYADRFPEKRAIHPGLALLRAWATFFKKYVLQRRCLAGWRGILLAYHAAHGVFVKHTAHYVNTRVLEDRQSAD